MTGLAARKLLREYCTPVNYLTLILELADEKQIARDEVKALIDSGEYGIGQYRGLWMIRKSKLYVPAIPVAETSLDRHTLLSAINPAQVYEKELGISLKDSQWQSVPCPFHEDRKPSFRILLPAGGFFCQSCGERGGNVLDFVIALHHYSFPVAINYLESNYTNHGGSHLSHLA